jgi:hypothetical protein
MSSIVVRWKPYDKNTPVALSRMRRRLGSSLVFVISPKMILLDTLTDFVKM